MNWCDFGIDPNVIKSDVSRSNVGGFFFWFNSILSVLKTILMIFDPYRFISRRTRLVGGWFVLIGSAFAHCF